MAADCGKQRLAEHARLWAANGPLLDQLRDREIRQADTAAAIRIFDVAFRAVMHELPCRDSSGLVEWQRLVSRWRRHG